MRPIGGLFRQLSLAIESMPNGLVITDSHGTIEYVNAGLESITGYSAVEVVGLTPHIFSSTYHTPEFYEEFWRVLKSGKTWNGELCNRRKDGTLVWVQETISAMRDASGSIVNYVAIWTDITELIRAREVAVAASYAKSRFLANMSHEIRTPMNAIIGLSHLCLQTDLAPDQRDFLNKIHASADTLLGVINDILDFSKIEAGKLQLEHIPFEVGNVIANIDSLLGSKAADKGLRFLVTLDPRVPSILQGDPLRLGQVLINLLSNSVKFTAAGTIELNIRWMDQSEDKVILRFTVTDTGIGMNQQQIGKIFLAFDQADSSTTRMYGGTGLGLAICKQLVELMGGSIGVRSHPGRGTSIDVDLSFSRGERNLQPSSFPRIETQLTTEDANALLAGKRILLVEDNEINRIVGTGLLKKLGALVSIAVDGERALEVLQHENFDVILMDIQMPNMDGITTTRAIRAQPRLATIPIIALTAHAYAEERDNCLAAGMNDLITKPIAPRTLYSVLARHVLPADTPAIDDANVVAVIPPAAGGLDAKAGLIYADGNPDLYKKLLKHFRAKFGAVMVQLRSSLAQARYDEGKRLAHMLCGTAGTIGATSLQHLAGTLEEALIKVPAEDMEGLLTPIDSELARVFADIDTVLNHATNTG